MVAGVIPDPLAEPPEEERAPRPLESAVLYVTREDWACVQDEFEALAGPIRLAQGAASHRWAAAMARAGTLDRADAVNLLQGEFARTTDYGARWHRWRTAAMLAGGLAGGARRRRGAQDPPGESRDEGARRADRADLRPDDADRDDAGPAPPDGVAPRPHPPSGPGPEYFLRTLEALSGAVSTTPKTTHRFAQLSRASARHEGDGTEPRRALAAVAAGRANRGCRPTSNPLSRSTPASRRKCRCRSPGAKARR